MKVAIKEILAQAIQSLTAVGASMDQLEAENLALKNENKALKKSASKVVTPNKPVVSPSVPQNK